MCLICRERRRPLFSYHKCHICFFALAVSESSSSLLASTLSLPQCQVRNRSLWTEWGIKKDLIKSPSEPSVNITSASIKYGYANKICIRPSVPGVKQAWFQCPASLESQLIWCALICLLGAQEGSGWLRSPTHKSLLGNCDRDGGKCPCAVRDGVHVTSGRWPPEM